QLFGLIFVVVWTRIPTALASCHPTKYRGNDPMPIPYHAFFSAEQVLDGNIRDRLTPYLTGKIVIYGARYALVKDRAFSPVHGHRYIHLASGEGTFRKDWTDFQPAVLMLFAGMAVMWNRRRLLQAMPSDEQKFLLQRDEYFLRWVHRVVYMMFIP